MQEQQTWANNQRWVNAFINSSATVTERAAEAIEEPMHKAVAFDSDGNVVLATSGEEAFGLLLSNSREPVAKGELVHILVKDIGLAVAGADIAKGDLVTVNGEGQVIPAGDGPAFGRAFSAGEAGGTVQVRIGGF